jgi:hypothetical protein
MDPQPDTHPDARPETRNTDTPVTTNPAEPDESSTDPETREPHQAAQ